MTKLKRWNPVHKYSEQGETRNRPSTIDSKKDKVKKGKVKHYKKYLLELEEEK